MKKYIIFTVLVVVFTIIQSSLRVHYDFYAGDVFVSFLIGGYIGLFSGLIASYLD